MGVMFAMILNRALFVLVFFLSTSCETLSELTGSSKPDIDDSLF